MIYLEGYGSYSDELVHLALNDNQTLLTKFVAVVALVAVVSFVSGVVGGSEVDHLFGRGRGRP